MLIYKIAIPLYDNSIVYLQPIKPEIFLMTVSLFIAFVVIVTVQLFYYLIVFRKLAFLKPYDVTGNTVSVSVIICAKNEEHNVTRFIPLLAEQNYPDYEIILIDDASSDATLEIFESFARQYKNIRLVKVVPNETFWGNKKFALTLGIKAATKEYLLFTDADCYPVSKDWIKKMTAHFTPEKTIVLGYGAYEKKSGSFLNKMIRYETVMTAVQYFSWAKSGRPYMGVGRNMAYKREEFFKVGGFKDHLNIRSGDDDLFINQVANKDNTAICIDPDSFTYSEPKQEFSEWLTQKCRHITTSYCYKFFDKLQLSIFFCTQLLFILLSVILFILNYNWPIVTGLILLRYLISWSIIAGATKRLQEKDLTLWFPVLEIVLVYVQLNIFFKNIFVKHIHWK